MRRRRLPLMKSYEGRAEVLDNCRLYEFKANKRFIILYISWSREEADQPVGYT